MFGKLFRKKKPRVFLGVLAVTPRTDLKRHFDEQGMFEHANLDSALRQSLTEIFSFAPVHTVEAPLATDLVLDIVISKFQSGDVVGVSLGEFGFPIFWRPKITVASRLYSLTTQKTKTTFSVTQKMKWGQYFSRIVSWRALLATKPTFDGKDMEYLLAQACLKLLVKIQKAA